MATGPDRRAESRTGLHRPRAEHDREPGIVVGALGSGEVTANEAADPAGGGEGVAVATHHHSSDAEVLLQQQTQSFLGEPPQLVMLGIAHGDVRHRRQQHATRLEDPRRGVPNGGGLSS